jgi:hypothetical protein
MNFYKIFFTTLTAFSFMTLDAKGCSCHKHTPPVAQEEQQPSPPVATHSPSKKVTLSDQNIETSVDQSMECTNEK